MQRRALFKVVNDHGIHVVDLATVLAEVPGIYRKFDGHWTEKGHKIVAEYLAQIIMKVLDR